jgi:hypothetical protein
LAPHALKELPAWVPLPAVPIQELPTLVPQAVAAQTSPWGPRWMT